MLNHKIDEVINVTKRFFNRNLNKLIHGTNPNLINVDVSNKNALRDYNLSRTTGPDPCVCYAPSRSLYLDIYGNAGACCFNRTYILGKYPENSLNEIIFGDKRVFLQKELARQNFMYGCQHCLKMIDSGNYEGVEARLYDTLKDQKLMPSEIIFELDNTCNLECAMCHEGFSSRIAQRKGISFNPPYDDNFIEQLKQFIPYLKVAKFLGGEPFLINIYYKIWDLIIEMNPKCKIHLQTNGSIFNDKIATYLKKGRFFIGVSIDSLDEDKFAQIRKNANLKMILSNLENFIILSRKKNNYLNISVCPMQQNWKEIPDLVEFCNSKGLFIYFNYVYTESFSLMELNFEELNEIIIFYKSVVFKNNAKKIISKRNILFFNNLLTQIESQYKIKYEESLPYIKRHKWNTAGLGRFLNNKLKEASIDTRIDNSVFDNIESNFLLSDKDVDYLKNIPANQIASSISNETADELNLRIKKFIENGRFGS